MSFTDDVSTDPSPHVAGADDPPDGSTGLPWPRTWGGVYSLVLACFVTWVTLLVVLERVFP
jgi:hypothetical protein